MNKSEILRGFRLNVLIHGQRGPEHQAPIPTIEITKGLTENGNTFIQLRDKEMSDQTMIGLGIQLRQALPPKVPLIINDRVRVALAIRDSGAKGVLGLHIGQKDMVDHSTKEIRELLGEDMILGVTASNVEEAKQAVTDGADYLGIGPIFATKSKKDAGQPIGLRGLEAIRAALPEVPIIAIGGIKQENAETVMRFGANGVAVISAVLEADNPVQAAKELATIVTPQERIPRLTSEGQLAQDEKGDRTMSRKEAETTGNRPVACVLLFKDGRFGGKVLLQQRAKHKSRWPKKWEGSVLETGQMADDREPEEPKKTAERGLKEEAGLKDVQLDSRTFFYRYKNEYGGSSIITVFTANYDNERHGRVVHDVNETKQQKWVSKRLLPLMVKVRARRFTPGFRELVLANQEIFKQ